MKATSYSCEFDVLENFPNARVVLEWEGGCTYFAEQRGAWYVIVDAGTLADLVDDDDKDQLVTVIAFESEDARSAHVALKGDRGRDSVRFNPWIGSKYAAGGYSGTKLLILGESHYHHDPSPRADFTQWLTQGYIDGWMKHRFWTLVARTVTGRQASRETCRDFWHSVAFYNYIQAIVGVSARVAPTAEMWASAPEPFRRVLEDIAPRAVLVLGKRLWDNLPQGKIDTLSLEGEPWPARLYELPDGQYAVATYINHPASFGFVSRKWAPVVAAMLGRARAL